jgi:hypothetical protein
MNRRFRRSYPNRSRIPGNCSPIAIKRPRLYLAARH